MFPNYRRENDSTESLSKLPEVTQLVKGELTSAPSDCAVRPRLGLEFTPAPSLSAPQEQSHGREFWSRHPVTAGGPRALLCCPPLWPSLHHFSPLTTVIVTLSPLGRPPHCHTWISPNCCLQPLVAPSPLEDRSRTKFSLIWRPQPIRLWHSGPGTRPVPAPWPLPSGVCPARPGSWGAPETLLLKLTALATPFVSQRVGLPGGVPNARLAASPGGPVPGYRPAQGKLRALPRPGAGRQGQGPWGPWPCDAYII